MEILVPLNEVLKRVKTPVSGYDLEKVVRSVIEQLSRIPTVVAIFVRDHHGVYGGKSPQSVGFIVVMQTNRASWEDNVSTQKRMGEQMAPLMQEYCPLEISFSFELWEQWRRQDTFAWSTRVWLRPNTRRALAKPPIQNAA